MNWTHRPTGLGGDGEKDRTVCVDGQPVGRVYQIENGPSDGFWQWSGLWVGPGHTGVARTFEDGLDAVREAYLKTTAEQRFG